MKTIQMNHPQRLLIEKTFYEKLRERERERFFCISMEHSTMYDLYMCFAFSIARSPSLSLFLDMCVSALVYSFGVSMTVCCNNESTALSRGALVMCMYNCDTHSSRMYMLCASSDAHSNTFVYI